eukprot:4348567-Pyramimonas_sp.AAC.1
MDPKAGEARLAKLKIVQGAAKRSRSFDTIGSLVPQLTYHYYLRAGQPWPSTRHLRDLSHC